MMKFFITTRVLASNQPLVTSTIYDGCCLKPYQVLYGTLKMFGGQQLDRWQRVNRVPTQNTDLYSRSIITQAHINKCMIYIVIIILFHVQYYYQILTTCQGINTLILLLHTIITVTIIYRNIASIMSNEEEFGDQRIS